MTSKLLGVFMGVVLAISLLQLNCAGGDAHSENNNDVVKGANDDTTSIKKDKKKDKEAEERIPVETTTVGTGDISSYILLSSNLETEKMTDVYSRVQGLVEEIYVEEGEYVKKDEVLMKLEADEYALEEAQARVNYEQEKSRFERAKAMYEKNLLSKEEFEQAKFAAEAKRIQWEQAKLNLDYTKITSPISGVIGERLRRPGDRIQPSDKLFTVINTEEMIAVVHVPEKEIGRVAKGQRAYVTSQHLEDERFSGWIKRVSPVVDPQSGTFKVTIGIRNVENRLRPGMFVNVHIITDTHENTVLIPKTAVIYESENLHVFVVRDSVAKKVTLDVGYQDYEKVESLSKIEPGEKVIVVGQAGLKDETKVKIVSEQAYSF
ncbi:efflux RND transporter periplasmic adaptor subunit [candidate division KSB1 bacterium]|nr:efflux RND transporter periplasmic adaptor subunit [candidate division KSB1 bacterium]NIR69444.1 efflux RND transporter periplasmic adaptor subunit [candidate division KSB1 bacterium]NIS22793.1 efflux RND transporter periplasmic adaptor subunit [candidate division KSB1 bacterium]NIT69633.1 efflux RND transporter periplasmic adaptor subunit [candidate division KSB1 bacterium]NIU23302.1 efflux RND transporter periplasmic adaptor subunit [candidate division KSB1 bacterium]